HAAKLHGQAVLERAQVRHGFQQFDAGLPASLGDLAAALDHLAPQLADGGVALPQIYREQDAQTTVAKEGDVHGAIARALVRENHRIHEKAGAQREHHDDYGDEYAQVQFATLEVIGVHSVEHLHRQASKKGNAPFSNLSVIGEVARSIL